MRKIHTNKTLGIYTKTSLGWNKNENNLCNYNSTQSFQKMQSHDQFVYANVILKLSKDPKNTTPTTSHSRMRTRETNTKWKKNKRKWESETNTWVTPRRSAKEFESIS
jgi:hypothetical protein